MGSDQKNIFSRNATDEDKVGRFMAGSSIALMATVISGTMSFAWTVIMSRLLGPEGFGLGKPFLDTFWMLSMAAAFGAPQAMTTFISHYHQDNPEEARAVAAQGTRLLMGLALILCTPAAVWALVAGKSMGPLMWSFAWLMMMAVLSRQMYFAVFAVLGGTQRIDLLALCNLLFPLTMLCSSVVYVLIAKRWFNGETEASVIACAAGIATGPLVQYIFSLTIVGKSGISVRDLFNRHLQMKGGVKRLIGFGWVAAIAIIVGSFISFVPPVLTSWMGYRFSFFGATHAINAIEAGHFSAAYTYAMAPMLIVGMIFALLPAISEAHAQGNDALMHKYFNLSIRFALIVIMLVISIYALMAGELVEFFSGSEYPKEKLGPITLILGFGMSACMLMMLMVNLLTGLKKPAVPAVLTTFIILIEIAGFFLAAKFTGDIFWVAAAFDAAVFLGLVAMMVYVTSFVGLRLELLPLTKPVLAACATIAILKLLPLPDGAIGFLAGLFAVPVVYLPALIALKGITKEDLKLVRK